MKVRTRRMLRNSFCATGPGGGVDPSCSPSSGGNVASEAEAKAGWSQYVKKEGVAKGWLLDKDKRAFYEEHGFERQGVSAKYKSPHDQTLHDARPDFQMAIRDHVRSGKTQEAADKQLKDYPDFRPSGHIERYEGQVGRALLEGLQVPTHVLREFPRLEKAFHEGKIESLYGDEARARRERGEVRNLAANWCNQYGGTTCRDGGAATPLSKREADAVEQHAEKYLRGLSKKVLKSIDHYTELGHESINSQMRSCPPKFDCLTGEVKRHAENLEKAIKGYPRFKQPVLVTRGMSLPAKDAKVFLATLSKNVGGKAIRLPSFTSTTLKANSYFKGSVRFNITAKHGLPIGGVSGHPDEREVLMSPSARYRVTKIEGKVVHLEQL